MAKLNRILAISIAMLLTLSMSVSITLIPKASAHTPTWQIPTWVYCTPQTNIIGVGQSMEIVIWLNDIPPTANGEYGDRWTFTVNITGPSGTSSLGPFTSDPIGTYVLHQTFDTVGNYTLVANFLQHVLTNIPANPSPIAENTSPYINDTYLPSSSTPAVIVVQQTPVTTIPQNPLPTDYWQCPVLAINRLWTAIDGNWLGTIYPIVNGYQAFSTAPSTTHIDWTKQVSIGGLVGAESGAATVGGPTSYYTGSSYEQEWATGNLQTQSSPPIVIDGNLYLNNMDPSSREGFYCVDLATGQTVWNSNFTGPLQNGYGTSSSGNMPQLSFGQIYDYNSPNQAGAFPYLWSIYTNTTAGAATGPFPTTNSVWQMFDASTGVPICNINNVPIASGNVSVIRVTSPVDGSELIYVMDPFAGWLAQWNSSTAIQYGAIQSSIIAQSNIYWEWRPYLGHTYNGIYGYDWNVTIPKDLPLLTTTSTVATLSATMAAVDIPGGAYSTSDPDIILGSSGLSTYSTGAYSLWALSLLPTNRGQLLWRDNFAEPMNNPADMNTSVVIEGVDYATGVFVMRIKETCQLFGYNLATGAQMWGPTASMANWMMFMPNAVGMQFGAAYGCIYVYGMAGIIYCYNSTTGALVFTAATAPSGLDSPYPNWPFAETAASAETAVIANGEIICATDEHSESLPLYTGWATYCWNATTGAPIWNITGTFGNDCIIADGYMLTENVENQQIECFGKGLSATTVEATPGQNSNSQVLLSGTVTDQSPGQTCLGIPAAGTPAIADADMSAWMQYLYLQYPEPTNVTGVPVTLTEIDPNGNYYTIGNTTSDMTGHYSYTFTPNVPGTYKIIATFGGSGAYYSSSAETSYLFDLPPATTTVPTATPTSVANTYFVPAIAGIIIIIIIGFIVLALLMLRKRP